VRGRGAERATLLDLVRGAHAGTSGALLVHGPTGIGKTTLLDAAAADAAALGTTVLRASGVAAESGVAWAGLSELLGPLAGDLDALPGAQARPLAAALALAPPEAAADRFAIGVGTLGLLAAAAARSPLLVLVDDVQWLDAPSVEALLFAGRRLEAEGIALVLARRDGDGADVDAGWLARLDLAPLDDDAARAVLADRAPGRMAPGVADRLVAASAGNPLALVSVAGLLTAEQRLGRAPLPDPLPAPAAAERDLTARLRTVPERARRALVVAAAHPGPDAAPVPGALRRLGLDLHDLAAAEAQGLLSLGGGELAFSHPLIRSAAYQAATPAERRAAHGALAAVAEGLEARARHLALAAAGPDDEAAACLDAAAERARARGAPVAAADLAARAAALSTRAAERDGRRIRAVELALLAGATGQARSLLDQLGEPDDPALAVAAAEVRGRWEIVAGSSSTGIDLLERAAAQFADADPAGAALLLTHAASAALPAGRYDRALELAERAVALRTGDPALDAAAELACRAARVASGQGDDGAALLALFDRLGHDDGLLRVAYPALSAAAAALIWLEDFERAEELVDAVVGAARRRGALDVLPLALVNRAWLLFRRVRVGAGIAAATEAVDLAEATGQPGVHRVARQTLAHLLAHAGRFDEARAIAADLLDGFRSGPVTPARYNTTLALAGVEASTGRHELAVALLEEIVVADPDDRFFRNPAAWGGAFQLVDAYARVGRFADARRLLAAAEAVVARVPQPWPRGQVARLRGLLADDGYDAHFAEAVELLAHVAAATVVARVDWADRLRCDGRVEEARRQLHEAYALARRSGFHGRTPAIVSGLAGAGERVVVQPDELARLTGQQLAVATSVAAGASIAEAASELFLSPQTVERELLDACRALGVTSADDLAARLHGAPGDAGGEAHCSLQVLGGCSIRHDGVDVRLPPGRPGTLLQLLAVHGGRATVDQAIEQLWPEVDPDVGRVRLRNVVSRVRRVVGDCLQRQGEVLQLAPDVVVDAARFRAAADDALARRDPEAAAAAVRLYGGPLLPELPYEPWVDGPRRGLQRRYLQLLDLLAAHARAEQRWGDAARYLELAIEAEPDDHERYVAAADARLRQGRRSTARHLCRLARDRAADLGVPPPPSLAGVEAALR